MIKIEDFGDPGFDEYRIECDRCKQPAKNSNGYPLFFDTIGEAWQTAVLSGFTRISNVDLCGGCSETLFAPVISRESKRFSPMSRLLLSVKSANEEFERSMMLERQHEISEG